MNTSKTRAKIVGIDALTYDLTVCGFFGFFWFLLCLRFCFSSLVSSTGYSSSESPILFLILSIIFYVTSETPIPANTHTAGARTSNNQIITQEKYIAKIP